MVDILVRHASWMVTMDERRRILVDGSLAVDDGRIIAVGKSDAIATEYSNADRVIDGRGKLVMPGLADGHLHNCQQLARGLADEVDIRDWLYERVYPFEAELTSDEAHISATHSQLEMMKAGTTNFIEPCTYFPEQVALAAKESGMRATIARSALDIYEIPAGTVPGKAFRESTSEAASRSEAFVKEWHGAAGGRIRGSFCLRILNDCSDELCSRVGDLATRHSVLIQTHGDANKSMVKASRKQFGASGIGRLERLGVLGPNVLMIHMGGIPLDALPEMKRHGVKGVSCPCASAHHGGSTSPFLPEMMDLGLDICFGSDSGANSNYLDVVRAMHFAALSTKRDRLDSRVMGPEQLVEMATLNAARVSLQGAELGSLEVGKKADVTMFDTLRPEWRPVHNPLANLVYCASGSSAHTVIVDGRVVMDARHVTTLDEEEVIERAQKAGLDVAERSGVLRYSKPIWPVS